MKQRRPGQKAYRPGAMPPRSGCFADPISGVLPVERGVKPRGVGDNSRQMPHRLRGEIPWKRPFDFDHTSRWLANLAIGDLLDRSAGVGD